MSGADELQALRAQREARSIRQRQDWLLCYIAGYLAAHDGIAPTLRDMAKALGLSCKSQAYKLLLGLEARGLVQRLARRPRAIRLLSAVSIPRAPDSAPLFFLPVIHGDPESNAA